MHELDHGPYLGNNVMGAIKMLSDRIYAGLIDAKAVLRDWNGLNSAAHRPPLSYPLVMFFAPDQFARGRADVGLAFLVGFLGLLRVSELSALCVDNVVFPGDPRIWGSDYVLLVLRHTMTGDDKTAELRSAWLFPFLRRWVARQRANGGEAAVLFSDAQALRAGLRLSLGFLGLARCGFVMHSFRSGAALHLLSLRTPLEEVLRRG